MIAGVLLALVLALAGCGGDDEDEGASSAPPADRPAVTEEPAVKKEPAVEKEAAGTEVILADSEFGSMLFGADKQAIYIFENDSEGKSVCYDECAEAWPPVYTKGKPEAGDGVRASLLGTVKRRDGKLQVAYAGQPLYYYAHEGPGEVRCHNVNLNGGLWWVLGRNGKRRP